MLLESALLEFSTDESEVFEDAVQHSSRAFEWETIGKSKLLPQNGGSGSNSDAVAGPAEIKHVYLDGKLLNSRQPFGEFSAVHKSKPLSDFLEMSRSPPAVDVNCGPTFESSRPEEVPVHDDTRQEGKEGRPGCLKNCVSGRSIKSAAVENTLRGNMSQPGETAGVPFAWEAQHGKTKLQRGSSPNQLQMPSSRSIPLSKNGKGVSPSSASPQRKEYKIEREQLEQRGRSSSSPRARGVSPIRQSSKVRSSSGEGKQIKKPDVVKGPEVLSRQENHRDRNDAHLFDNNVNSKYRYYEDESPVSILARPPSPPTTNSSGSSGSSVHSPPATSAPALPLSGGGIERRRPSDFSSPSAQESPRASTSSSTRYMGQCLIALQAALAIDPEKSKRFEDSFVELDTYVEGDDTPTYAKSPIDDDEDDDLFNHHDKVRRSPVWARDAATPRSDLEPEYHTMDFYSDSDEEIVGQQSHISPSSSVASLARSSSGSSISGPIRRSLNYHRPMRADNYSSKDRRFLSSHPSSWVEHGDDSISSSLTNSKCNTLTRHQEIPWDEQQADLDLVRAEEVVRGAIDGLRFTYSPVSSAFVFTRSNEGDEELGAASGRNDYGRSPHDKTFTDYEGSRRFSISLDYDASIRSEDSMSFARGSDVTELGMSRAESWSKVARGIALQQGYQDAIPSSFIRRAGNAPMYEEANASSRSPAFNPGGGFGEGAPDSRLVRKQRLGKKSGMTTCLPFRAILRNFRTLGSPGRSRLGLAPGDCDRTPVNRLTL